MNKKLFAILAATFVVWATLSGGTTVAILSDSETVTTIIAVGNTAPGNTAGGDALITVGNTAAGNTAGEGALATVSETDEEVGDNVISDAKMSENPSVALLRAVPARTWTAPTTV